MSLVGPRPEVRRYVEMFRDDYAEILRVRPGITDPASIKYRHEAEILGRAADPEKEYVERILPEKIRLAKEYAREIRRFGSILLIILKDSACRRPPAKADGLPRTRRNEKTERRHDVS